ncbi:hypothetical protein EUGRSUZ_K00893 [Eucalyptus grandis]|uniref:Uncharacterized protein n=2 Tax=Eucalyptus grandis TaxID=71139 RepID=A0ACC3IRL8_EUCGR|nr:hypothetical protein EUGRSUZ_K00893 [Eucalyptus grandis]
MTGSCTIYYAKLQITYFPQVYPLHSLVILRSATAESNLYGLSSSPIFMHFWCEDQVAHSQHVFQTAMRTRRT